MTKRRLAVLLIGAVAVAAGVGGLVYSRTRGTAPDAAGAKVDDTPPPVLVTKVTAPARKLNDKEQMLVGKWKFDNINPKLYSPGYEAAYEFKSDGTYTFSFSSVYVKHWSRSGQFRVSGDILIKEVENGESAVNLIEELTTFRFVVSAQNGLHRDVKQWTSVRSAGGV